MSRRATPGALALVLFAVLSVGPAWGHALWPASLRLVESGDGSVSSRFEVPLRGGQPLPLTARLPEHCVATGAPWSTPGARAVRIEQRHDCAAQGLVGGEVSIGGLEASSGDAMVVIEHADGRTTTHVLRVDDPAVLVPGPDAPAPPARRYLAIGVEHIWTGIDHVLFVIGLVLVAGFRPAVLFKTVSAFTVTHSLTLALSTLGLVHFPTASVEAVIALSILLLAVEVTGNRERSLTVRHPWAVAGACGLIHGLGFAGALAGIGLPEGEIPLALLNFNLGVEAGQLVVVGLSLLALAVLRRVAIPPVLRRIPAYALGAVAAFWFLQRASAILWP